MDKKIKEFGLENKEHLIVNDLKSFNGVSDKKKLNKFPWEDTVDTFSRLGFIPN